MLLNTIISFVFRFVVAAIWLTVVFFPVRWLAGRATQWFRHQAFKPRVAWGLGRMIFWLLMVAVGLYPVLSLWGVVLVGLWAGVQVALTVATVLTLLETFGKEPHVFEDASESATPQEVMSGPPDTSSEDAEHGEPSEAPDPASEEPV